jgi:membrane protein YdbS with pleckstrin-like domain
MSPSDPDQEKVNGTHTRQPAISFLVVRKSVVLLITYLILLDTMFLLLFVALFLPNLVNSAQGAIQPFSSIVAYIAIAGLGLKISTSIWVIMQWLSEYYEIHPQEIVHRRGVFMQHREVFNVRDVKSMTIKQNLLGRMFRFGTVILFNPALDQKIAIHDVTNPHKHLEMIAQFIPGIEEHSVFMRSGGGITTS